MRLISATGEPWRPGVLIVDDQPTNLHVAHQVLDPDCEVSVSTDSRDVLDLCRRESPDLVLLDIQMPHLDGFEVCKQLKSTGETRDIPVIFLTSSDSVEDETRGLEVGAVDFISKPINPAVLRARVKTHLTLKSQSDRLREMVFVDGLTGVANRRHFDERFGLEWRACRRSRVPLGLILIDIDHFKAYNDHYGHQGDDEALQAVAQALRSAMRRPRDFVARYGGEEFVCLIPDSDGAATLRTAEYLLSQVQGAAIPHAHSQVSSIVTISAGVVSEVPKPGAQPASLLQLADARLYSAKRNGRARADAGGSERATANVLR